MEIFPLEWERNRMNLSLSTIKHTCIQMWFGRENTRMKFSLKIMSSDSSVPDREKLREKEIETKFAHPLKSLENYLKMCTIIRRSMHYYFLLSQTLSLSLSLSHTPLSLSIFLSTLSLSLSLIAHPSLLKLELFLLHIKVLRTATLTLTWW